MTRYLVYRLLHSLIVVIGVTIIAFLLLHHLPGGPFGRALPNPLSPRQAASDRNSPTAVSSPALR